MAMLETICVNLLYIFLALIALAACIGVIAVVIWVVALLIKTWRDDNA